MGKEVLGYLEEHGGYRIECVLDEIEIPECLGYRVVHPFQYSGECRNAILAVGMPQHKQLVLDKYAPLELNWLTFVHPTANVSRHARIGCGSVIAPFAAITGDARLGEFVLVNVLAAVCHDAVVGNRSSIFPYGCVTGHAQIGTECMVGAGAKVLPGIRVGDRCRISAGAVVSQDMPDDRLVFGNPARGILHPQPEIAREPARLEEQP
jgi:sugar O-acyltransferase (sialic acid O-acetyltransferase NeuD family)